MTSIDRKCLLGETPLMQTSFIRNIFCIGETLQLKGKKLCLFNLGQKKFLTFSLFLLILFFPFLSILSLWLNLKIKFPPFVSWFGSLLDSDQLVSSVFGAKKEVEDFSFFLSYFFEAGGAWRTKVRESGFTVQRFGGEEFLLSNDLLACCFYFFSMIIIIDC